MRQQVMYPKIPEKKRKRHKESIIRQQAGPERMPVQQGDGGFMNYTGRDR